MNKLKIEDRKEGMKLHKMRTGGFIPGTMYGPTIKNKTIKASFNELNRATKKTGEVYQIQTKNGPVFVKFGEIQQDPVSQDFIHFSLVEMPRGVKNEIEVPIALEGTPKGVTKGGVLVVMKDELTINGAPRSIPEEIKVNVSKLDIGDKLTIDDLNIPKKVESMEDESQIVAVCKAPAKVVETEVEETVVGLNEMTEEKPRASIA